MKLNKGFSLIELMIVVGIIGILSLIGLPMYKNYVERVKLTEVVLNHLYLIRQLETEFNSGGAEAIHSYAKSACSSTPNVSGPIVICDTNIGISGIMVISYTNASITISIRSPQYQPDADYGMQLFSFVEGMPYESLLMHYPKSPNNDSQPIEKRSGYGFVFVQQREGIKDSYKLKITKEDLGTYFADFNRWYCGSMTFNNEDAETPRGPISKVIRPRMCNFTAINFSAMDGGVTNFIED